MLRRAVTRAQGGWVRKQARMGAETPAARAKTLPAVFMPDGEVLMGTGKGTMRLTNAQKRSTRPLLEVTGIKGNEESRLELQASRSLRSHSAATGSLSPWQALTTRYVYGRSPKEIQALPYELHHRGVHTVAVKRGKCGCERHRHRRGRTNLRGFGMLRRVS